MVQKVLPSIRAELAQVMITEYGCTQQKVAEVLGLSRAAVSQYVSSKRGAEVGFSDETHEEIRKFAGELLNSPSTKDKVRGMCSVCKYVQKSGWLYKNAPDVGYCVVCGDVD